MEQEHVDSDEDLMLAYKVGDAEAFETLYQRFRGPLYRYLLRQCGEPGLAEELFQDIWMRVIRARRRYQPQALFKTYLFHLAHNVLIDHYRHRSKGLPVSYEQDQAEIIDAQPGAAQHQPEQQAASREQLERLRALISELPEAQREAFLLHEEGGLTIEEIARVTDVKREAAKSRLRYAIQRLRKGLRDLI